jgi:hypothetical protein
VPLSISFAREASSSRSTTSPASRPVDGIAELESVELAARFKDSEGNILAVSQFLVDATGER